MTPLTPEQEERREQLYNVVKNIKQELQPFVDLQEMRSYFTEQENAQRNSVVAGLKTIFSQIAELENILRTSS
jgi:hypothetical protein